MPAANSSTGEQKALLLGLVMAHAELVAERRGEPPLLLLDEVAAHLDPRRRAALFTRLEGRGQVWMTATEASLFDGIGDASRFHVEPGRITRPSAQSPKLGTFRRRPQLLAPDRLGGLAQLSRTLAHSLLNPGVRTRGPQRKRGAGAT